MKTKSRIRKGDKVILLSGKDRGKIGIVEKVSRKTRSVLVSKTNLAKKNIKASKKNPAGGIVDVERPLPDSRVQIICPSCDKKTRISIVSQKGEKKRICKICKKPIEAIREEKKEKN